VRTRDRRCHGTETTPNCRKAYAFAWSSESRPFPPQHHIASQQARLDFCGLYPYWTKLRLLLLLAKLRLQRVHSDAPVAYANTSVNAGLAYDETIHVYIVSQLTAAVPVSTADFFSRSSAGFHDAEHRENYINPVHSGQMFPHTPQEIGFAVRALRRL
jgi:hypothetical protein